MFFCFIVFCFIVFCFIVTRNREYCGFSALVSKAVLTGVSFVFKSVLGEFFFLVAWCLFNGLDFF